MNKLAASLLVVFLAVSIPLALAEKAGEPGEDPSVSKYVQEESASRNFQSWWLDHSGYLILPHEFRYTNRPATADEIIKLLLLYGYRGAFQEVVNGQAISELQNMGPAVKMLGMIVNDQFEVPESSLPAGVRKDDIRCFAAMALGEIGRTDALPTLLPALSDKSQALRACAAVSIGRLGGIEHRDAILASYRDLSRSRDASLRSAYLTALAHLADPAVLPELISTLNDRDPRVRRSLATVFGIMAEDAGPNVVNDYLRRHGSLDGVRLAALWALSDMGRDLATRESSRDYTGVLADIESSLINAMRHENVEFIRCNALFALGHLGTPRAQDILRSMAGNPENPWRLNAQAALLASGFETMPVDETGTPYANSVATMLECKNELDREKPAIGLVSMKVRELANEGFEDAAIGVLFYAARSYSPSRLVLIEGEFDSNSPEVGVAAIISAGMVRGRTDVSRMAIAIQKVAGSVSSTSRNTEVARFKTAATMVALGMLDSDKPLRLLFSKAASSDPLISACASISIAMLGGLPYRDPLISAMENPNNAPDVRAAAAFSLGLTDAPGVLESLVRAATRETNVDLRVHAIFALGLHGDQAAVPALFNIVSDSRLARSADGNYIRGCAAVSLVELKAGTAYLLSLKREMERSDDENFKAFCALAFGLTRDQTYLEALVPLLESPAGSVRLAAAIGLGLSGDEQYLPELQSTLANSRHDEARVHAAVACGLLGDPSASAVLLDMLDPRREGSSQVRLASAMGLMLLGHKDLQVLEKLAATSSDPDPRVRKYSTIARFVLGDSTGIDDFVADLRTSGMEMQKLDADLMRYWANSSLPTFFKLRSYLFH